MARTFKALCEEIAQESIVDVKVALLDGIKSHPTTSHAFLKLFRDSIDGQPVSGMHLQTSFREDELISARQELERKMATLYAHATPTDSDPVEA